MKSLTFFIPLFILNINLYSEEGMELKDIHTLQVYDGIIVNIVRSDSNFLELIDKDLRMSDFKITEEYGTLKIRLVPGSKKPDKAQLRLKYKSIGKMEGYGRAEIWTENLIIGDHLEIVLKSGAQSYADMDVKKLVVRLQEGALLKAEGYAIDQQIDVVTNSTFSAYELEGSTGIIEAKTGGIAKVNIEEELSARASYKGFISYKGSPKIDKKKSFGGIIEMYSD